MNHEYLRARSREFSMFLFIQNGIYVDVTKSEILQLLRNIHSCLNFLFTIRKSSSIFAIAS